MGHVNGMSRLKRSLSYREKKLLPPFAFSFRAKSTKKGC